MIERVRVSVATPPLYGTAMGFRRAVSLQQLDEVIESGRTAWPPPFPYYDVRTCVRNGERTRRFYK